LLDLSGYRSDAQTISVCFSLSTEEMAETFFWLQV
jgi:hypothetical protein